MPEKQAVSSSDGLQTLHRALAILDLFDRHHEAWTPAAVASELGLAPATASRLLRGLQSHGLLIRTSRHEYRLGLGAVELGHRALRTFHWTEPLRPVTSRLARESGETAVAFVLNERRDGAVVVDRVEGQKGIQLSIAIGHTLALEAGLAKTLLSHLPSAEREAALGHQPSEPLTRELDAIRDRGWVISYEGVDLGTWGVGASVLERDGSPLVAIGVIAPIARHSVEVEHELVELVRSAAADAHRRLGLAADLGAQPSRS
jgi:DNA-binding IclR family transcriptional regulator